MEGFSAQRRLDASQFGQVHQLQVAVIYRAVHKLLQEMLEGVSDAELFHPVSLLYVNTVRLWKARFIAEVGIDSKHNNVIAIFLFHCVIRWGWPDLVT